MKNTLAENMLRFGVKNLQESDLKKIEETILTEQTEVQPYAAINPKSYKFKDDASHTAFISPARYAPTRLDPAVAAAGTYGPWAFEIIPQSGGKKQINQNVYSLQQHMACDIATIMAVMGYYNSKVYSDFARLEKDCRWVSNQLRNKLGSSAQTPDQTFNARFGLSSTEIDQRGYKTNQKEWSAAFPTLEAAIAKAITTYALPKPAPAAATPQAAAPGTPAPVKKN